MSKYYKCNNETNVLVNETWLPPMREYRIRYIIPSCITLKRHKKRGINKENPRNVIRYQYLVVNSKFSVRHTTAAEQQSIDIIAKRARTSTRNKNDISWNASMTTWNANKNVFVQNFCASEFQWMVFLFSLSLLPWPCSPACSSSVCVHYAMCTLCMYTWMLMALLRWMYEKAAKHTHTHLIQKEYNI